MRMYLQKDGRCFGLQKCDKIHPASEIGWYPWKRSVPSSWFQCLRWRRFTAWIEKSIQKDTDSGMDTVGL